MIHKQGINRRTNEISGENANNIRGRDRGVAEEIAIYAVNNIIIPIKILRRMLASVRNPNKMTYSKIEAYRGLPETT